MMGGEAEMVERDKVIKGLEYCATHDCSNLCHYWLECDQHGLAKDALELLKEQEAAPVMVPHSRGMAYNCGACGTEIAVIRDTISADWQKNSVRYCQRCGKAVKWE